MPPGTGEGVLFQRLTVVMIRKRAVRSWGNNQASGMPGFVRELHEES